MHGLIFRTLQLFVQDTYGMQTWDQVAERASLESRDFEAMLHYEADLLTHVIGAAAECLEKPTEAVLEDVGTYLVSHPNCEALRRLLRFGGVDFIEFLHSLDDLPGRARLAVSDLDLPDLELRELGGARFLLQVTGENALLGQVMVGILRAMADDYGTLVLLERPGCHATHEEIEITVIETEYAAGKEFALGAAPASGGH